MLTDLRMADQLYFEALRAREFARLDAHATTYLDYTGSALYGASQIVTHAEQLADSVLGNPHSAHAPSRASTAIVDAARAATLRFFDVDESTHDVCFTGNASAAIKLVAESYPFGPARGLVLSADNHNSINGVREYARRASASVKVLPLDEYLRLDGAPARLAALPVHERGLLAFPALSNFSGVLHRLELIHQAHELGVDVLLDAAAYVPTTRLSLRDCPADFTAISFYKMFGYPTGLGALIVRREAMAKLRRPWFAGGAVDFVSVQNERHQLSAGHAGFEDGTPNFLALLAVEPGLAFLKKIGMDRLSRHVRSLAGSFIAQLLALRHANGAPLVRLYGPRDLHRRGATVAFNLLSDQGQAAPYGAVEAHLGAFNVALRGGCFCNPGASEAAFNMDAAAAARCFDALGGDFTIARFARELGDDHAVGALRASFGAASVAGDVERAVAAIAAWEHAPRQ